jgi:hypothetical protein
MTERLPIPTNYDKVTWAASGGTKTDPGGSVRSTGWAFEQIPGYDEFNWIQNILGDMADWLRKLIGREWSDINEGIANTTTQSDQFKVYHSTTGLRPRGLSVFDVVSPATGGGVVNHVATDGEFGYFFGGTGDAYINRIDPGAGGQEQEYNIPTGAASALDADGQYVYYHNTNAGVPGLRVHDRLTLAQVRVGGAQYACDELRSNGSWCVGISPAGGNGRMVFYTGLGGTVTENTVTTAAAALVGLAIDGGQCYSSDGAGNVYAYTLAGTPVNSWITALPTTTTAAITCLAADGNAVYVGTDTRTVSPGQPYSRSTSGNAVIWALDRITGDPLWSRDLPGLNSICISLAVDQGYLYALDGQNDELCVISLRAPEASLVYVGSGWGAGGLAVDGVSAYGASASAANIKRAWFLRRGTQTFMRVLGNDSKRAPFHTLALPINDGV